MQMKSLLNLLKQKLKQSFCNHPGYSAEIEENPQPVLFLNIKAECSECGITNSEIIKKATDDYKIRLADNVLFQRNVEKFPAYYEAMKKRLQVEQVNLNDTILDS